MRAIQIAELSGPDSALRYVELPDPEPSHPLAPPGEEAVVVVVHSAPAGNGLRPGDRVAAFTALGAFAETAVAPAFFTFKVPDALDFAQGAGLVLNYHTAYFA